jgi:hypothetical protein
MIKEFPTEILSERHHLTDQQLSDLFGRQVIIGGINDKISGLETVNAFIMITDELRRTGVDYLTLKGPLLSWRLYKDPVRRRYRDIDILVDAGSVQAVTAVLQKAGYVPDGPSWPCNEKLRKLMIRHRRHISYSHPVRLVIFEIHWRFLADCPVSHGRLDEIIKENEKEIEFAGRNFKVLSNDLELLFLIIHGGLHSWFRLKWLLDVDTYLKTQTINWDNFRYLASELRADRLVRLCKSIHQIYFPWGPDIPIQVQGKASETLVKHCRKMIENEIPDPTSLKEIARTIYYSSISFPGMRYKLDVLSNYLYVSEFFSSNGSYNLLTVSWFFIKRFFRLTTTREALAPSPWGKVG